jgi:hypothetical protein
MKRSDLLQILVLDVVADDYEDFAKIVSEVSQMCGALEFEITRSEVFRALEDLIRLGLIKAYFLSPWTSPMDVPGIPSRERLPELHFLQTEKGRQAHDFNCSRWPLDECGALLEPLEPE